MDKETGHSRGFGFVNFNSERAMDDAIESLHGKDLDGRPITVNRAKPKGRNRGRGLEVEAEGSVVVEVTVSSVGSLVIGLGNVHLVEETVGEVVATILLMIVMVVTLQGI